MIAPTITIIHQSVGESRHAQPRSRSNHRAFISTCPLISMLGTIAANAKR